jgi:hypothetical protein
MTTPAASIAKHDAILNAAIVICSPRFSRAANPSSAIGPSQCA